MALGAVRMWSLSPLDWYQSSFKGALLALGWDWFFTGGRVLVPFGSPRFQMELSLLSMILILLEARVTGRQEA